jgi:hypothetical protein
MLVTQDMLNMGAAVQRKCAAVLSLIFFCLMSFFHFRLKVQKESPHTGLSKYEEKQLNHVGVVQ